MDVREPPKFIKQRKISKTKVLLTDITVLLAIFVMIILFHEYTHSIIFKTYGCTDIKHGFEPMAFYTTAKCPDNSAALATDINEIAGYNITPFLGIIIFLIYKRE